jgi:hypothetical protein
MRVDTQQGTQLDADGIICRFQLRVDQGAEMHAICWDVDDIAVHSHLCLGLDCVGPFDVWDGYSVRMLSLAMRLSSRMY